MWLLVAAGGEPVRETSTRYVRADVPHLLVRDAGARVTVGPFVEPGRTACLRCVDAHVGEGDPRRPVLVEQRRGPSATSRSTRC